MLQCWSADHESATPKTMETILDKAGFKATKHRFWNTFRGISTCVLLTVLNLVDSFSRKHLVLKSKSFWSI